MLTLVARQRRLLSIHAMVFILLLATWLAGVAIAPHAGTPLVALYYVLHIFPGSLVFVLVLFYLLNKADDGEPKPISIPLPDKVNGRMHHLYYGILLALPLTGILIFFEQAKPAAWNDALWWIQPLYDRFFYHLHALLFDVLLGLVVINVLVMLLGRLRRP